MKWKFGPRWKEELVCGCEAGALVLEMPMGITSVYLPTREAWASRAPAWAVPLWDDLHEQLKTWCDSFKYPLYLDATAQVSEEEKK